MKENRPNILMIVADQWRADSIGYTGCEAAKTPHLDALAAEGVGFLNAFCQNPVCVPSRCSFLTGFYPHTKGFRTMHNLMKGEEPNLLKSLKQHGYEVFWGGRNDFLNIYEDPFECCDIRYTDGNKYMKALKTLDTDSKDELFRSWRLDYQNTRGDESSAWYYSMFKGVMEQPGCMDKITLEGCSEFIKNRKADKPFLAYLSVFLPHPPYIVERDYYEQIERRDIWPPLRLTPEQLRKKPSIIQGIHNKQNIAGLSDEELTEIRRVYLAMGTKLDEYIGGLLKVLKQQGIYDDTVIVFMSDHGDYTGDYELVDKNQNTFEECLVHVPLIMKGTKEIPVEKRNTPALTELIDVQATIMDICGVKHDYTQFGKSLLPVLTGEEVHRDAVFCEGGRLSEEGWYAMDSGHDKTNEYWPRTSEQEHMPQHTKAVMIRTNDYKYIKRLYEEDEFYDLTVDPHECNNLINDCKPEVLEQMKARMMQFLIETSDVVPHVYDKRS